MRLRNLAVIACALIALWTCPLGAEPASVDARGDALPQGAVARLGTTRLWHGPLVKDVIFLDNDRLLSLAGARSYDIPGRLWDAATGKLLGTWPHKDKDVSRLVVSPDRTRAVVMRNSSTMHLLDLETGKTLASFRPSSRGNAYDATFRPDGKQFALAHQKGVEIHATAGQELVRKLEVPCNNISWSPDGKALAVTQSLGRGAKRTSRVALIDPTSGDQIAATPATDKVRYNVVSCSPGGKYVAAMHRGTDSIHILNAADLSPHKKLSAGASVERSALFGMKWSPDGRRIASGGRFHQVHCWDAQTGDLLWEHNDVVAYTINVAWSPDGKRLAGGGRNGMLYIWDAATGEPVISHKRHVSAICQADISDDGRYAMTAGAGGDVCTWRMEAPGSPMALTDVTYRPGGALFAAGSDVAAIALDQTGTVEVVDVGATRSAGRFTLSSPPIYTGLGAGGRSLVVIDKEGMLRRVDFRGKVLAEARALPKNPFDYLMAWRSDDSRWVATAVGQATELHYVPTGKFRNIEQSNTLRSNGYGWGRYQGLAFSPDNACFAMIADRTVQVIETDSLKTVLELDIGPDSPTALRFSPSGRIVAVGTARGRILLFSAMTGREIHAFAGHEPEGWRAGRKRSGGGSTSPLDDEPYSICHLRYEQGGKRLLSGSADHTVLIWDTAAHAGPEPVAGDKNAGQLWELLGSDDASEAWEAAWAFGAMGHQGAVFLADKLRPADRASRAKVLRLVQQLRSRKFAARKAAQDELEQIASQSVEVLEDLVDAGNLPAELETRVKKLIAEAGAVTTTTTAALQKWRGIRVLERIGTPAARQVLLGLSRGAKGSHLTQLAIGALERMGR